MIKVVEWIGSSLKDVQSFPKDAKREIGHALDNLQHGYAPADWKPMPSIGSGVYEIRVHTDGEYRVVYITKFCKKIYVLHAFKKKTQKTPKKDIDISQARLKEAMANIRG